MSWSKRPEQTRLEARPWAGIMASMAGSKPLLLLDVDGVLNPFAADSCPEEYREHDLFPGEESVRLADIHGTWLREVAEVFELVWATGWGQQANRLLAPILRLPQLPAIEFPLGRVDPARKVPSIRAFVRDRPLAWLDDMITGEARRWAAKRRSPTLLVHVDPAIGLTEPIVVQLKAWAQSLPERADSPTDRAER